MYARVNRQAIAHSDALSIRRCFVHERQVPATHGHLEFDLRLMAVDVIAALLE